MEFMILTAARTGEVLWQFKVGSGIIAQPIVYKGPDGKEMTPEDWGTEFGKSIAVFLNGEAIPEPDSRGERIIDDSFLLCFNGHDEDLDFVIPQGVYGKQWTAELNTAGADGTSDLVVDAGEKISLPGRSVLVLRKTA